jgi:hypothetical protein
MSGVGSVTHTSGWRWGPFTFRLPFLHTRLYWPEFLQGVLVASATGLALVPIMTLYFGLSFEQALTCAFVHAVLIASALILFGEPYAPGWVTPALPLVLAFVLMNYEDPVQRWQAMTALSLNFAALVAVLGLTGLGAQLLRWIPDTLKAGIILGAALAAFKRVLVDDAERFLLVQPIATVLACAVCLVLLFSEPFQRLREKHRWAMVLAALGLLPGFLAAAIVGPLVGEVTYEIEWGIFIPPVAETWAAVSPWAIGWPSWDMYLGAMPLAIITYVILFGDLVTGQAVIADAQSDRPDEEIELNSRRSHLSLALRNAAMGVTAPFFPTQGSLWAGVHVVVVQRWRQGAKTMRSLHDGMHSYYLMGLPFIYAMLPLLTGLKPLMGIALSLTLIVTGFACAYIALAIPQRPAERGVVLMTAAAIALIEPWVGLVIGLVAALTIIGPKTAPAASVTAGDKES